MNRWIIAITGSSGVIYSQRLLQALIEHIDSIQIELIISDAAIEVFKHEMDKNLAADNQKVESIIGSKTDNITLHSNSNIAASVASGSYPISGMTIVPCSMKTVAGIACGYSDNLILRAADVILKEKRPLIVVPRESPMSTVHLRNLTTLSKLGVSVVPAMPGFYSRPQNINDLINIMVMRIADQMGYELPLANRWIEQ